MTTRHPFDRLLSAYRDKFFSKDNTYHEIRKANNWHNWYGKEIIEKQRVKKATDPKYGRAPTFREFVKYLMDLPMGRWNSHWKPMYLLCLPCHIKYQAIARMDTLDTDSQHILHVSILKNLTDIYVQQGHCPFLELPLAKF